ncbi:imidazole glycerol phosphate synthase subunit HisH [Cellulosilyticum sp. I15G10I2]|uniref:imidazole glycerol phosphate synthase subunit HisH n=1 Tax=Cellulosilyticum sp. I15G10I2 TaxID=1892843 RepID=UPI00085C7820|nr:imidazole glycerol phosphate synthase subunit HisH [Cellulosilyticum sp. I15G10I2]
MKIAIIDYGMGNLKSVYKAFLSLGLEAQVTSDPKEILKADKVVLPGVGAFKDAMGELNRSGLTEAIYESVEKEKPFLGICLGMQLLFDKSYEYGEVEGLKLLKGEIVKLDVPLKVPHMGWNTLNFIKKEPLFTGLSDNSYVYFVHSYYLETQEDIVSSTTSYGKEIAVSVQKDNIFATQFHPEKSGEVGLQMLKNFGGM